MPAANPIRRWAGFAAAAAHLLIPCGGHAQDKCRFTEVGAIHVDMVAGWPVLDASINGQPVRLLLDTGTSATFLSVPAARRLQLGYHSTAGMGGGMISANGGVSALFEATISDLGIEGQHSRSVVVRVAGGDIARGIDGILGADFLGLRDLELDLPHSTVRLITARDCRGDDVVYWGGAYTVAPLVDGWRRTPPVVRAQLNGAPVSALIDTGASRSFVSFSTATAAGAGARSLTTKAEGLFRSGGRVTRDYIAPFATFTIGDETVKDFRMLIAGIRPVDMLLGNDFLMSHRLYISHSQQKVYISYTGGQVFIAPEAQASAP